MIEINLLIAVFSGALAGERFNKKRRLEDASFSFVCSILSGVYLGPLVLKAMSVQFPKYIPDNSIEAAGFVAALASNVVLPRILSKILKDD